MRNHHIRWLAAAVVSLTASTGVMVLAGTSANAATACKATYTKSDWGAGFTTTITLTNLGDAWTSWNLKYSYAGNQTLTNGWSAKWSQSGKDVTVANEAWNGPVATNGTVTFGGQFTYSGTNTDPTTFSVNGVTCNGVTPTTTPTVTPTVEPTVTPTVTPTGQPGTHVENPFAGAKQYVNPDYAAQVQAAATEAGGTLGAKMAKVAQYPTAVWMDRIAAVSGGSGVTRTLAGHLDAALAQQSGGTPVVISIVVYDLPGRDCHALASNGELPLTAAGLTRYKTEYIDPIAATLAKPKYADLRVVAVIEPDSMPNLVTNLDDPECAAANSTGIYRDGTRYALDKLHVIPNVYQYMDIGHSGWLGWDNNFGPGVTLFSNLVAGTAAGKNSIDGFVSNTAGYTPTEEIYLPDSGLQVGGAPIRSSTFYQWNPYFDEKDYVAALRTAFINAGFPSGIGMLIDTGRNGWGGTARPTAVSTSTVLDTYVNQSRLDRRLHRGNWCNQSGAGIGARPVESPFSGVDAFVWVKPPGESDGDSDPTHTEPDAEGKRADPNCMPDHTTSDGVKTGALGNSPAAGHWFPAQFTQLVQNAFPVL